ncbi:MAG: sialidase family protein [Terracidiphilus sp.]
MRSLRAAVLLCASATIWTGTALRSQGLFEQTELFVGGQDNYNTYRIPSLICTKSGTVLAFSEGRIDIGKDGGPTDIVLKRSLGNGGPWTPAFMAARGEGRNRQDTMMWLPLQVVLRSTNGDAWMNPVPVIDQTDGTIYLLANLYPQPYKDANQAIWFVKSTDEGATWSTPVEITQGTGKHEIGPGAGIQLRSGRLMIQVYDSVIFSDDHGKTWKSGGIAPGDWNETQVVQLVDGSLLFSRRKAPNRVFLYSKDDGETWSQPVAQSELPDPDCQGSMIRFTREDQGYTKNRILFANPVSGALGVGVGESDPRGRFNVTVRMSYDEGKTWPIEKRILTGPGAYSSMTVFPDGSIGILFETGIAFGTFDDYCKKLVFARFTVDWLTDGKDHLDKK